MDPTSGRQTSFEDAFIRVSLEEEVVPRISREGDSAPFSDWSEKVSGKTLRPIIAFANVLRKYYPKHSLVTTQDYSINILGFPDALSVPLRPDELITNSAFIPVGRNSSGVVVDSVEFGCFRTAWDKYEFTIYIVRYLEGFFVNQHFILHEESKLPAQQLLRAVGAWYYQLHEEIWVFNQGFWNKDAQLYADVQKANWDDVILEDSKKKALQHDVYSFFDSEKLYKELGIPWKRGMLMYGPPGNGKTISLKAIMKTVQAKGYNPLYVKSFQSWRGEEGSMEEVFSKARILAPCVIILEDLDSLINDRNRSFFMNQLDGIAGNDGLLLIGTTNHMDRLDPGLSTRPSRFDRKYEFDNPTIEERRLYVKYWQNKLKDNEKVDFTEELAAEIANLTHRFSFAYMKECFVSSLVLLLTSESKQPFSEIIKNQIKTIRKQLDDQDIVPEARSISFIAPSAAPPQPDMWAISRRRMAFAAASAGLTSNPIYTN